MIERSRLQSLLDSAGLETVELGKHVLIMPHGGRIIGLFPDGVHNVFWVNEQSLREPSKPGWPNFGGDRTWISPELDVNMVELPSGDLEIVIPAGVDPSAYSLHRADGNCCELQTTAEVYFRRADHTAGLTWRKTIDTISEIPFAGGMVDCAGYRLETKLSSHDALPVEVKPGLWNLIQVPEGNGITIPTRTAMPKCRPFISSPNLEISPPGSVSCVVDTPESYKFGIAAADSLGMVMAELSTDVLQFLLVRTFQLFDEKSYSDVPADDQSAIGFVQQIYVDDGRFGGFGELEYHTPYIRLENGFEVTDTCMTFAYAGRAAMVKRIRDEWLGAASRIRETLGSVGRESWRGSGHDRPRYENG